MRLQSLECEATVRRRLPCCPADGVSVSGGGDAPDLVGVGVPPVLKGLYGLGSCPNAGDVTGQRLERSLETRMSKVGCVDAQVDHLQVLKLVLLVRHASTMPRFGDGCQSLAIGW